MVLDELDACGPDGLRDVELSLKALCLPRVGFKIQVFVISAVRFMAGGSVLMCLYNVRH